MEKLEGDLGEFLQKSIETEETVSDCVNFNFDIKILSVKGKFCKSGILDVTVTVAGVQIQHLQIDLSDGEYCNKVSVGVEEVRYCFYVKKNCLYTKGYVDGWFHPKETWDEKIVCI
ncbi:hypothetical protein [Fodinibius halophilus]|uniref:Uncharacterized protein n=1 Tax=Fodinibius halophilus TaxID=1736908 RepID=A0A6M1TH99_9BACT|nr:hypothetical protein [Fodinibius halophilus]NGP88030.1 hypothetical protein [Fodinibius halophilus]